MTWVIYRLTLRQLVSRKRAILMVLFALIPVLLALVFQASDTERTPQWFAANRLYALSIVGMLMPLTALIFGTSAIGSEVEDGTAVYLLSKPIPRWQVIGAKFLAAWSVSLALVLTSTVVSGAIVLAGHDGQGILPAFVVAVTLGTLAYSAIFVLLSVVTSRALIVGLIYVFIWEGLISRLFTGTRVFSVRQYTLGIADALSDAPRTTFSAALTSTQSFLFLAVVSVVVLVLATRRLRRFEIGEST